ncbi:hypothetical protein [Fodinibius halophilus]|uniref:Uncharacterized protein n=1 Tax=Fodinibius halophilus TaxID=1736908 RepID=A0A6M1T809_9BACT|nr:hypothetical protein [Fodinibius halophilus]NGP88783.1 hypothetical protein [Fodinibius halophilus]
MEEERKPPLGQRILDNMWLLLALGLAVPTISYTLWGIIELISMGDATLP